MPASEIPSGKVFEQKLLHSTSTIRGGWICRIADGSSILSSNSKTMMLMLATEVEAVLEIIQIIHLLVLN